MTNTSSTPISDYRIKQRLDQMGADFGDLGKIKPPVSRRAGPVSQEQLNRLEANIAAVEAAFEDDGDTTFTAPGRDRYNGRTDSDVLTFLGLLEVRVRALRAAAA